MDAKTLSSIFRSIPACVRFPWEADTSEKTLRRRNIYGDLADGNDDVMNTLFNENANDEEEIPLDSAQLHKLVDSASIEGGMHIGETERREAVEKAQKAFLQHKSDSIAAAKAIAEAASAAASVPRPHSLASKRPRHAPKMLDRSDPDLQLLEKEIDTNSNLISKWERGRDSLTADEQESTLLKRSDGDAVTGTICLFHVAKSYGFIAPDCGGPDVYFTRDSIVLPTECQQFFNDADSLSLVAGERVSFSVALNVSHSSRRLKAVNVRVGSEGRPAIYVAYKGRRFSGKVRNYNTDVNRGYIQNTDNLHSDMLTGDPLTLLQKCHCKHFADAVFSLTPAQLAQGALPCNGSEVDYQIMPCLDARTGRIMAVNCDFKNFDPEAERGQEPSLKAHRAETTDHQSSDTQESPAIRPRLLLLDDAGSW